MRPGPGRSRWAALALSCLLCSCTVTSDINVLTGESTSGHPARNLYHPLLTNARGSGVEGFSP